MVSKMKKKHKRQVRLPFRFSSWRDYHVLYCTYGGGTAGLAAGGAAVDWLLFFLPIVYE